ncbi:MAG: class I SAM-dependent methyltransferase [Pirellulaceae bacterium]
MVRLLDKAIRGTMRRVRDRGVRHAFRWVGHHVYERYRERRLGVETARYDEWKGSVDKDECHDYEPLAYACIERGLDLLTMRPGEDVLLDYGCGKGRAVVVAAARPLRKVIGLDVVEPLVRAARENVERARPQLQCRDVAIVAADATQYTLPPEVTVIYMYNPFWGETLRQVQQRIEQSLRAAPRRLRIVYMLNADQNDAFQNCDWLHRTHDDPDFWENVRCVIYESRPTDVADDRGERRPQASFTKPGGKP